MRRHKDETMAEFDARIAAKNSELNMGWLDKGKQRKSASAELVDKIAKDARKERKKREAAEDARAEKEYDKETRAWGMRGEVVRSLDFNALRAANVARSESKSGFRHPLNLWSIAEWTNALQAEAGEAGNFAKKILRLRLHSRGNKKVDRDEAKLLKRMAQEVADAVVYADLCLASEGISLSDAVRDTFNRKSKEIGYKFKL